MHQKGRAIVLSSIKFKESDLIVKCYTSHRGVVSYLQKGILKSKRGASKSVYFQPLSLLDIDENYQSKRSLQYLREVKLSYHYKSLHTNVYKASLAVFIAEILSMVLKEEESNHQLFDFLETSFQYLDVEATFANFHLVFLIRLSKYLGFYPEVKDTHKPYFNLESGHFENTKKTLYLLEGEQKKLLTDLLNVNFYEASSVKMKSPQRMELLQMLLLYFELHLGDFKKPKSIQVFNEVFH